MMKSRNEKSLTKKDLENFTKETLLPTVDKLIKRNLAEFTEGVLLPAVERIVDDRIDEKVPKIIEAKVPGMINKAKLELMDHFDDKIADLRGDVILLLRKDDRRFLHLVDVLYKKNILNKNDIKTIEELQLFPKMS